jgi:hypothetical protein
MGRMNWGVKHANAYEPASQEHSRFYFTPLVTLLALVHGLQRLLGVPEHTSSAYFATFR